jgi:hypothetical protein
VELKDISGANAPVVIYHGDCADGFSAAWCFWRKFGDAATYVPGVFQTDPPDVTGRDVYLVDFSYPREVVQRMIERARSVTLIDHHKTAIEALSGLPGLALYVDLERSGATLAWDFLFEGEDRPAILGHIEDRDLWRFKLPGTKEVFATVASVEHRFEDWDRMMNADALELMKITVTGAALLRKHTKDVAEVVSRGRRRMTIAGHDVPAVNAPPTMTSDACNLLAESEPSAPFAAAYWDGPQGRVFSLRSMKTGADVSEVAQLYGGGGHAHAAGFRVEREHSLARA